jgi:signal transduction histidine kinase
MSARSSGCPPVLRAYPAAVLEISADGTVLDSNGRLEQDLKRELIGRNFAETLDAGSNSQKWTRILQQRTGESTVWELIFAGSGGLMEPRSFSAFRDPAGETLWLLEHPRDRRLDRLYEEVTGVNSELAGTQRALRQEKRRLDRVLAALEKRQEELARINRELDEFAQVVSHDLQAPLRSIRNYAEWVREEIGADAAPEVHDYLQRLLKRAGDMEGLIHGVLEFARAGRSTQPARRTDVGELVREIFEVLQAGDAELEIPEDLPVLTTDRLSLQQVFLNLLGNAIRHGRGETLRISVDWVDEGEMFRFWVRDQGPGIEARRQERIWNLFYTTASAGEAGGGTGVGLPIVRKLVERQGGRITLESAPGAGASFSFSWPKRPADEHDIEIRTDR